MNFFKKIFSAKTEINIETNQDFWGWFVQNEKQFFKAIQQKDKIVENVLDKIIPKLQMLNEQFYCQVGKESDTLVGIDVSAEGDIKTFVFVEELIKSAPKLPNWQFQALKPATPKGFNIGMHGYDFSDENINFFATNHKDYPDEIDITLVHNDHRDDNEKEVGQGCLIYLDALLGELNTAVLIDSVTTGDNKEKNELIPIGKLEDYLKWREAEFVERYKSVRYSDEDDTFSSYEFEDKEGNTHFGLMNRTLLDWDVKPSHPWMMVLDFEYESNESGMPNDETFKKMNEFEDELTELLPCSEGYLNIGRRTGGNTRTTYFACKDFRHSSKCAAALIQKYADVLKIEYTIYRDKYWMTLENYI
jgi:Family of unknown function (DUF695)